MKLTCNDLLMYLSDYIDGDLNDTLTAAAREHLLTCENCSIVLDSTRKTIALFRAHSQAQLLDGERHAALYARIAAAFAAAQADDTE